MARRAHHQLCAFGTRLTARQGGSHAIGLRPAADARLANDSRPPDRPYATPRQRKKTAPVLQPLACNRGCRRRGEADHRGRSDK